MITDDLQDALLSGGGHDSTVSYQEPRYAWSGALPDEHPPIIGIPIPVQQGHQGPLLLADAVGAWAIERLGGRVLLIPLWPFQPHKHMYQSLWSLLHAMDGLLLPAYVQETDWSAHEEAGQSQPGPEHWPRCWELALAQLATYIGMPVLALADGAQTWNRALGGKRGEALTNTMQVIPTTPDIWERQTIRVQVPSKLALCLQSALAMQDDYQQPWELAFLSKPTVEQLAPGLRSCAQSEDGTLVAFERQDLAFGLGILGRLDWGLDQPYGTALFAAFLQACQSFDRARKPQTTWEASRNAICATLADLVTHGRSLIPVPQTPGEETHRAHARSGPLSTPLSSSHRSIMGQETGMLRYRKHAPFV